MRISKTSIERVADLILSRLIDRKLVRLKALREKVKARIVRVIADELKKEDALDREVEALIEKNKSVLKGESVDYNRMFGMIKAKLAKERGVVL